MAENEPTGAAGEQPPTPTPTPAGGSDAAAAALKAAQAAIAAAKAINTPTDANAAAEEAMRSAMTETGGGGGDNAQPLAMPDFGAPVGGAGESAAGLDLLRDVNLNVTIELGRTRMLVEDVLKLGEGSVVELDKLAGDPVDVFVNDRPVARGEVLVLNDNFCVRINEIIASPTELGPG